MHINHLTMMKIESIIPPKKCRYVFPFIDYRFNLMMYPSGAYMYILDRARRMRVVSSVPWCRHAFWACYSRKQFNRVWSLKTSLVVVCAYGDCKCPQVTRTNSSTPRRRWCGTATSLVASLLSRLMGANMLSDIAMASMKSLCQQVHTCSPAARVGLLGDTSWILTLRAIVWWITRGPLKVARTLQLFNNKTSPAEILIATADELLDQNDRPRVSFCRICQHTTQIVVDEADQRKAL